MLTLDVPLHIPPYMSFTFVERVQSCLICVPALRSSIIAHRSD